MLLPRLSAKYNLLLPDMTHVEESFHTCTDGEESRPGAKVKKMANAASAVLSTAGTAMFSMGIYFHKEATKMPETTGKILIPAAMAGWGVVIMAMSMILQAPARVPNRYVVAIASFLLATTASGTALTSVASASEASDIDDVITANMDRIVLLYGNVTKATRELDFIQVISAMVQLIYHNKQTNT